MPYINPTNRNSICLKTPGELNYNITMKCLDYIKQCPKGLCYQTLNDIIGVLEACKLEFYRRVVIPYEEKKIIENGDVY